MERKGQLEVLKLTDADYMRRMENAVQASGVRGHALQASGVRWGPQRVASGSCTTPQTSASYKATP